MNDLMSTNEIAEFVGVSPGTIRKFCKEKKLKAKKTGNGWTTLRHIVEDFREEYYGGRE